MSGRPTQGEAAGWSGSPTILCRLEDGVFILTLNRPEARNAVSLDMVEALHAVFDRLGNVDQGVVVIHGAGEKAFASGADIAELLDRGRREALEGINARLFTRIEELHLVTIAAVEGYALGGGCELALACDLRVGSRTAVFGQPEVGLGIAPGAGGAWRWTRLIGLSRAKEIVLTARRMHADEAHAIGLLHRMTPPGEAVSTALGWARSILDLDPCALRLTKGILNASPDATRSALDAMSMAAQAVLFESPGKKERMSRFLGM